MIKKTVFWKCRNAPRLSVSIHQHFHISTTGYRYRYVFGTQYSNCIWFVFVKYIDVCGMTFRVNTNNRSVGGSNYSFHGRIELVIRFISVNTM